MDENATPAYRYHYADYKTILSAKNTMNIYRGCLHGCIYCDSRSDCYHMGHDFEDIEVKRDAPKILEGQLRRRRKACMIGTGSMCDPYLPIEEELGYTRACLEVIEKYGFGVSVLTKSARVLRDLGLLVRIHKKAKAVVQMTLTSYDEGMCRILEPNVSTTAERFHALEVLGGSGIPTVVWLCPLLPYINDTEENLLGLLEYCVRARVSGIVHFGFGLTLRDGNREYFYAKLDEHFPGLKETYMRVYGDSYECPSPNSKNLDAILREVCASNGIACGTEEVFSYLRAFEPKNAQMSFFDIEGV